MADSLYITTTGANQVGPVGTARVLHTLSIDSGSVTAFDATGAAQVTTAGGNGAPIKGVWTVAGFYGDLNINMNNIVLWCTTTPKITVTYD